MISDVKWSKVTDKQSFDHKNAEAVEKSKRKAKSKDKPLFDKKNAEAVEKSQKKQNHITNHHLI